MTAVSVGLEAHCVYPYIFVHPADVPAPGVIRPHGAGKRGYVVRKGYLFIYVLRL